MTDNEILIKFCVKYEVQKDELLSRKRYKHLVDIRTAISKELREQGWSYPRIGELLNRHHTSIMNLLGVVKTEKRGDLMIKLSKEEKKFISEALNFNARRFIKKNDRVLYAVMKEIEKRRKKERKSNVKNIMADI